MIVPMCFSICSLTITEICSLIGVITAAVSAIFAICKYKEHVKQERIRYLLDFGNKYTSDLEIKEVITFLEQLEDDKMYKQEYLNPDGTYTEDALKIHSLEMFMRFIEELELLVRGHAVSESAALNLFGFYTTILEDNICRWPALHYEKKYWNVFRAFVQKARKFDYNKIKL